MAALMMVNKNYMIIMKCFGYLSVYLQKRNGNIKFKTEANG